jgi:deoxyribodipyrimidine photo-lyase
MTNLFPATRNEAQRRLLAFAPRAGPDYEFGRNTDNGPDGHAHVSLLSPYLRHRLISEREVVQAVFNKHTLSAVQKYVQEVLWRTYWKGWLEMRPGVWSRFVAERDQMQDSFPNVHAIIAAETGMTGIDGFDDWARELVETGYLHNHARMWFASIWIFTLRLPWALGADFFLRHLIDADAASNTLSWRWVAGLQTVGKTYLATAENITRYTNGRYAPTGLALEAIALTEAPIAAPCTFPEPRLVDRKQPSLLLMTHEDMNPESLIAPDIPINAAMVVTDEDLLWGEASKQFVKAAENDVTSRIGAHYGCNPNIASTLCAPALIAAAQSAQTKQIVTPYAPVGPVADVLARIVPILADEGITLIQVRRDWDTHFWPHARKGFFSFKEKIEPGLIATGIRVFA